MLFADERRIFLTNEQKITIFINIVKVYYLLMWHDLKHNPGDLNEIQK